MPFPLGFLCSLALLIRTLDSIGNWENASKSCGVGWGGVLEELGQGMVWWGGGTWGLPKQLYRTESHRHPGLSGLTNFSILWHFSLYHVWSKCHNNRATCSLLDSKTMKTNVENALWFVNIWLWAIFPFALFPALFFCGRKKYRKIPPEGNVILQVSCAIGVSIVGLQSTIFYIQTSFLAILFLLPHLSSDNIDDRTIKLELHSVQKPIFFSPTWSILSPGSRRKKQQQQNRLSWDKNEQVVLNLSYSKSEAGECFPLYSMPFSSVTRTKVLEWRKSIGWIGLKINTE